MVKCVWKALPKNWATLPLYPHASTEKCMKCGFSYETDCWRNYCEERFLIQTFYRSLDPTECCTLTMHGSHMLIQIPSYLTQFLKENDQNSIWKSLHVICAWEPHVNPDSFIFQTQFLTKKLSKFHLKIPTHQSQHCLQSNLSQIHLYHGLKRPKRKEIATCGKFVSPQQLLWATCCWDVQGISCTFCANAMEQKTVTFTVHM